MRTVYLLRHAKSSWDDAGLADHDRPLAPRGIRAATRMEEHLRDEDVRPDLVLCSSAVRARQTLDHVRPALGDALVKIEPTIYEASADAILELLRGLAEPIRSVMVVGHNPGLQDLAVALAAGGSRLDELTEKYPTGALATLVFESDSWASVAAHQAELSGYAVPRELD
ncbi:MAG: SixA phosphatase family protein [Gaiellales bacterium]